MSATRTAVLFPGQGAHHLDMLDGVSTAKRFSERCEVVCRALKTDPLEELRRGNREFLNRNKVSSLLTVFVSSLSWDLYRETADEAPAFCAGYSVGQWTALYAAGALSFPALIEIVAARADFMDECFRESPGAMLAFIGVREAALEDYLEGIREQGHFIAISNYNCLGQFSAAGTKEAVELAYSNAEVLKPRKVVMLPVQGAWHCPLLEPAEKAFAAYLQGVRFDSRLLLPVVDTMTGDPFPEDPEARKECMASHVSHPVRWEKGMKRLVQEGCSEFVEVGYGNVLTKFGFFIDRRCIHRSFYTE